MKSLLNKLFGKQDPYKPSNRLEEMLIKAASDLSLRPEFYRQMFHYRFYVLGKGSTDGNVQFMINEIEGERCLYAFTSLEALQFVANKRSDPMPFIEMAASDFFPIAADNHFALMLNANMDFGKLLKAHEIVEILRGGKAKEMVIEKGSKILLSAPENVPPQLLEALKGYIEKTNGLDDIYFGLQHVESATSYVLALRFRENSNIEMQSIVNDIGVLMREVGSDKPVDMVVANRMYQNAFENGVLVSMRQLS